jgi:hypothetical protein
MHTNFQSVQTFSQTGSMTADLVWSMRNFYISIRASFGKAIVFIVVILGAIILRGVLWFLIRKLKKEFRTDIEVKSDNYKELKTVYMELSSKIALLAPLKRVNFEKTPFLVKKVLNQILIILSMLEDFTTALEKQLVQLDNYDTGDSHFEIVRESTLWSMRTPHYEYRF